MNKQELLYLLDYVDGVLGVRGTFTADRLRHVANIAEKLAKEARDMADKKEAAINALNNIV